LQGVVLRSTMNAESFLRGNQKNLTYLSENKAEERIQFLSLHLSEQPTTRKIKGVTSVKEHVGTSTKVFFHDLNNLR